MSIKKAIVLLSLALFLVACLFGCTKANNIRSEAQDVAIITKGSDSDFWNDMKSGALSAANEFNIHVTVEGPENEEDYAAQNEMIENAISRKAGVIILSAIDYEKNAGSVQKAIDSGIQIITVDSDVDVKGKELFIGTDNKTAGEKAAKQAVAFCKAKNLLI